MPTKGAIEMFQHVKGMGADRCFAGANLAVALITGLAVFGALPGRWLWVDLPVGLIVALLVVSAVGLIGRARWADRVTRVAGVALLVGGLLVLAGLTLGMTFYRGVAGPGAGPGPLLFAMILLLALPYTVVYPAGLLLWLGSRGAAR
jgi:hypothetical protein